MGSADTAIGPGELCSRLTECLTCVSKWEEAVVRQEMRKIIHLMSGTMTVNFFNDDFCILCRFAGFCIFIAATKKYISLLGLNYDHFSFATINQGKAFRKPFPATYPLRVLKAIECSLLSVIVRPCQVP